MSDGMPSAPEGAMWVLHIDAENNDATLWIQHKMSFKSKPWPEFCAGVKAPTSQFTRLPIRQSSVDQIVEAVVDTARKMLLRFHEQPAKKAAVADKVAELSKRLGIKVEVH